MKRKSTTRCLSIKAFRGIYARESAMRCVTGLSNFLSRLFLFLSQIQPFSTHQGEQNIVSRQFYEAHCAIGHAVSLLAVSHCTAKLAPMSKCGIPVDLFTASTSIPGFLGSWVPGNRGGGSKQVNWDQFHLFEGVLSSLTCCCRRVRCNDGSTEG